MWSKHTWILMASLTVTGITPIKNATKQENKCFLANETEENGDSYIQCFNCTCEGVSQTYNCEDLCPPCQDASISNIPSCCNVNKCTFEATPPNRDRRFVVKQGDEPKSPTPSNGNKTSTDKPKKEYFTTLPVVAIVTMGAAAGFVVVLTGLFLCCERKMAPHPVVAMGRKSMMSRRSMARSARPSIARSSIMSSKSRRSGKGISKSPSMHRFEAPVSPDMGFQMSDQYPEFHDNNWQQMGGPFPDMSGQYAGAMGGPQQQYPQDISSMMSQDRYFYGTM